jgi:hypothetical protein
MLWLNPKTVIGRSNFTLPTLISVPDKAIPAMPGPVVRGSVQSGIALFFMLISAISIRCPITPLPFRTRTLTLESLSGNPSVSPDFVPHKRKRAFLELLRQVF